MAKPIPLNPEAVSRISQEIADSLPLGDAYDYISGKEGYKAEPYKDSAGKWTIGVGTLIGDGSDKALKNSDYYGKSIDEDTAKSIAQDDIYAKAALASEPHQLGNVIQDFSPELQAGVISGYYRGDLSGSPETKRLLNAKDYEAAANEFLDSDEYRKALNPENKMGGVATRMEALADLIRTEPDRQQPTFMQAVENGIANTSD